tara:strand:- start:1057 stop:1929 length:873 start_codon:yes stop_codon:yes gene_type:complete
MNLNKGIILAGGTGSRLFPITLQVSKQLLPVYDKPMIYYPLSTLLSAQIKNILIISTSEEIKNYSALLGDGSQLGINIEYASQDKPEGIAQAFVIAEDFIANDNVALILGDNIFYGSIFDNIISRVQDYKKGALLFAYKVPDPERYGVIEIKDNKIISLEEKPKNPKSPFVVTGLYFYDSKVVNIAKSLKLSKRKEYEITDVNHHYFQNNDVDYIILDRGTLWLDAGTTSSLLQASQFVETVQQRQNIQIGCPEEIVWRNNWISDSHLKELANQYSNSPYGIYLSSLIEK